MTAQERAEFRGFCRQATDSQVLGIIEKERRLAESAPESIRAECAELAEAEAERRGIQ
jgi:hypothetical protein